MYCATRFRSWSYPTAIRFGAGRIAELPEACRSGIRRPLLVTDPGRELPGAGAAGSASAGLRPSASRTAAIPSKNVTADWRPSAPAAMTASIAFGGGRRSTSAR